MAAYQIGTDPYSYWSYAGLLPFVPAGTKSIFRAADKGAELATTAASTIRKTPTGQIHHPISKKVHKALGRHPTLKGKYKVRDKEITTRAVDRAAHRGYQKWHRELDAEVAQWIADPVNRNASQEQFETWLRWRYGQPDLKTKFPEGF